jgi:hypothetical protein
LPDTGFELFGGVREKFSPCLAAPTSKVKNSKDLRSDVEEAVIGHGKVEGPFTEIDGLEIERDERYPIRVTVQFYKATSNGAVYYRVHALPDEIIWLVMPTRKPRKSKNSKDVRSRDRCSRKPCPLGQSLCAY